VAETAAGLQQALAQVRKERVHTTMLIEVLALLVFLAMAFAFVFREEGDRLNPWKDKADRFERALEEERRRSSALAKEILSLNAQINILEESIRRLEREEQGTLPANDSILVSKDVLKRTADKQANLEAMLEELTKQNALLRTQLAAARGKGGVDLPNCPVTAGFLVNVELLADGGFRTTRAWRPGADDAAAQVPGLGALASGSSLDRGRFLSLAGKVAGWGHSRPEPCGFRATVTERHSDVPLLKRQLGTVQQYFYVKWN
jgi:hypothetical protein